MADPFSITVGAIGLLEASGKVLKGTQRLCSDYREASKQVLHAKSQLDILKENVRSAQANTSTTQAAQFSLENIDNEFPSLPASDNRWHKVLWSIKDKKKFDRGFHQLKETEISFSLALLLRLV